MLWLLSSPVASFAKEVNPLLAKRPLKTNGRLANLELTSLAKEATGHQQPFYWIYIIKGSLFSTKNDFNYLHYLSAYFYVT